MKVRMNDSSRYRHTTINEILVALTTFSLKGMKAVKPELIIIANSIKQASS
jgi:hypothetical protein